MWGPEAHPMKICVVGTGYVGLVAGTCLSESGNEVTCVDKDESKISRLLRGEVPIYEPGLEELIHRNAQLGRLKFTTDLAEAVQAAEVCFIAVGTPPGEGGEADLSGVYAVARSLGDAMNGEKVVVIKSTVPVGTADQVRSIIESRTSHPFDVVSNPEFLREGQAIGDFMSPDRIIIGSRTEKARAKMAFLYQPHIDEGHPILYMDNRSAEMSKYAANSFLATKISFINEVANLCEKVGANIDDVRRGVGSDDRIGHRFLHPGVGYGGSCFPKDVKALVDMGKKAGYPMRVLLAVEDVNEDQKRILSRKVLAHFGSDLRGRHFAVWGLSFKPQTDDMREAPALVIIDELKAAGATVTVYDPEAMEEARHHLGEGVRYAPGAYEALEGADALLIITEWKEFHRPDLARVKSLMKGQVVFDGRNVFEPELLRNAGFTYYSMGRV